MPQWMRTDVLGCSSARHPNHSFLSVRFPSSAFQHAASIARSESSQSTTASNFDDGVTKHDAEVPAGSTWIASPRDTLAAGARWDDDKGGEISYTFASAPQSTLAPSAARLAAAAAAAAIALPLPRGQSHRCGLLSFALTGGTFMAPLMLSLSILPGGAVPKLTKYTSSLGNSASFPISVG